MEHFSTGEEWQGEIHERAAARALRRSRLPEPFFCARYSFSPYQGCGHGCLYCDGRAERYYVEGDFSRDIAVRINLPELLAREIGLARERAPVAVGSGVSDAYQPAEKRMRLTRACAEVIESSGLPVILATKSSLVERDLDIWSRVNRQAGFVLLMSINTTDELLRSRMEPGASSISDRFQTLRRFKDAGCGTGILAMPLLPFLSDAPASIERLVERA
ncbi:radical SAM protein, partial [Salinispira pacifica]